MKARLIALALLAAMGAHAAAPQLSNSIGMEFVLIQPGSMQIGVFKPECPSPQAAGVQPARPSGFPAPPPSDPRNEWTTADYEACARLVARDTSTGFRVEIRQSFYIGKFEVTQSQWQAVMGRNPATFQGSQVSGDSTHHPVESISWNDAQAFVAALNRRERTRAYRLPTEFEWEYACRAGGPGQQSWSDIRAMAVDGGDSFGFGAGRTPRSPELPPPTTRSVGTKQPNAWGLHDMLGNVWEWVQDPYNGRIFADPTPARSGPVRVLKGGGFVADVKNAICATHAGGPGDGWDVGLRIVKDAP